MNNELATNAMQNQMQLVMNRTKQKKLANLLLQGLNIFWLRNWRLQPCFFCPGFCYEASEVMLLVSFLSSMLICGLLEPKEPFSSFVASYNSPVQYQSNSIILRTVPWEQPGYYRSYYVLKRNSVADQGDYLDLVHSDYMVLEMISQGRLVW